MTVLCLLVGGPTLRIRVGSETICFEDHSYCGPMPVSANGNGRSLGPHHPFWHAVTQWYAGGKKLDAAGFAVWT